VKEKDKNACVSKRVFVDKVKWVWYNYLDNIFKKCEVKE